MDLQNLVDIELIKQLKHRYVRAVDTIDVDLLRSVFTEDAVAAYSDGKNTYSGRETICEFVASAIGASAGSTHMAIHPEIKFHGPNEASAIWRLEDFVNYPVGGATSEHIDFREGQILHGGGYYFDRYVKQNGEWLISRTGYYRLFERRADQSGTRIDVARKPELRHNLATRTTVATPQPAIQVSHFGVCVSDLDRALNFYCGALGFEDQGGIRLENEQGNVMGLQDFTLVTRMLTLGPCTIELLHYPRSQDPSVASGLRRMNHTGLTHLALSVADVDAAAAAVLAHGGQVFPETRSVLQSPDGQIELLYAADPDFTRVELIRYPPKV